PNGACTSRACAVSSCYSYGDHRDLHSFPTRRSSDLIAGWMNTASRTLATGHPRPNGPMFYRCRTHLNPSPSGRPRVMPNISPLGDRKSTRLNSSHVKISYAVFCLKKKKKAKSDVVDR